MTIDIRVRETLPQRQRHRVSRPSSNWILCALIFAIALGFNLYRLGVPSVWFDEAFSVELARQPLPLLWHIIFGSEPNMELYYLLLHGWLGLTAMLGLHATEFVVRLPSAIFAALSTVVVFLLGRRFLGLPAGLVGASLYLLNDLQLVYAQQARSYSLQLLLICIAWYAFLAAVIGVSHHRRWWACYAGATTLAVYAHLFSLFILLAQLCAFVGLLLLPQPWRGKARRQLPALFISLAAIDVLIIPMLLVALQGSKTGWLLAPHLGDVTHLLLAISGDSKIYLLLLAACCVFGLFIALLAYFPLTTPLTGRFFIMMPGKRPLPSSLPPPPLRDEGASLLLARMTHESDGKHPAELQQFLPVGLALACWLVVPVVVSYLVSQRSPHLF